MTIQPLPNNLDYADYLTIEDVCLILDLGRTTVTSKVLNSAQLNINYIVPTSSKIKKNLFKKSFVVDRVRLYDPNFDTQKIIDYISEVVQVPSGKEPVTSNDSQDLVKSLYSHINTLTKQVDSLVSINNQKDVQIAKNQELLSESNQTISFYQKQVQTLIAKETLSIETPKSETFKENDTSNQTQKEKPKSWLSWLGF